MHDSIRLMPIKDRHHGGMIANIHWLESIAGAFRHLRQGLQIARIGQTIHIDRLMPRIPDNFPHHGGSDESRTTCH